MQIRAYVPGAIGRIVELHGRYYTKHWRLSSYYFEARVANELGALLANFDPKRDGFWVAAQDENIAGGIAIDGSSSGAARLRFFIVDETHQGAGLGERLMRTALDFCREAGHKHVFLTTVAGLPAAHKLYKRHGFALTDEHPDRTWGVDLIEQRFDLQLGN